MPWTETTRSHYERRCPRYASDLTDAEWALIEPLMPTPNRIGRPRDRPAPAVAVDNIVRQLARCLGQARGHLAAKTVLVGRSPTDGR